MKPSGKVDFFTSLINESPDVLIILFYSMRFDIADWLSNLGFEAVSYLQNFTFEFNDPWPFYMGI